MSARGLSWRIFGRFAITLIVYTGVLIFAFIAASYVNVRFLVWRGNELLYPILHKMNSMSFFIFCWIIGFIIIFLKYWMKPFEYLDAVVDAGDILVNSNEEPIELPAELNHIEMRMNQIKQEAIRNAYLAKEAEQRKNDLIVYLAHDLKTPLTSVIGYLTLLHDEPQISEDLRGRYLSISLEKAERLEELINEFFDITRFNLSQLTLEISKINLTRMLEQIIFEFSPLFDEKGIECVLDSPPDTKVTLDSMKMERVFDNLLRNAINYSYENSTIEVIVKDALEGGINIIFRNHGKTISKEKLNRIFEQFYRLDTSRGTKGGGSGLGLAIAKEIIEAHGGTITAISEDEVIEFVVHLPEI